MTAKKATRAPAKLPRPKQIDDLTPDQLVAVILRLTMEISVLRDRLDTHEVLLGEKDILTPDECEAYSAAGEVAARRRKARDTLIDRVISDLADC